MTKLRLGAAAAAVGLVACGLLGSGASPGSAASEEPGVGIRPMPRSGGGSGDGVRVCGDPAIVGEVIPRIDGKGACGIWRPVRVDSVAGVNLNPQPTINCRTARALRIWVEDAARAAFARRGEELVGLDVADHYSCRGRNRATTGPLSEHSFGRAVDISGFRLAVGRTVSVAEDWDGAGFGATLKAIHAAGCGPFSTTLGPGSDGYHETHLHYDIEARDGDYCR